MLKRILIAVLLVAGTIEFKTQVKTKITPLESILTIDPSGWNCDQPGYKEWLAAQQDLDQWIDILKHKDGFDGDLQVLAMVKQLVDGVLQTVQHLSSGTTQFVQMKRMHSQISKHFKSLSLIESKSSWYDIDEVLEYVEVLNKAKTDEDKVQIAQTIATKISELMSQISDIQYQLSQTSVDIDQLYDTAAIINEGIEKCSAQWAPQIEADDKLRQEQLKQEEQSRLQEQAENEHNKQEQEQAEKEAQDKIDEAEKLAENDNVDNEDNEEQQTNEEQQEEISISEEELSISEEEISISEEEISISEEEFTEDFEGMTPEEIEEYQKKAEHDAEVAEKQEHDAELLAEEADEKEHDAQIETDKEEAEAKAADEAAKIADENAKKAELLEEEACLEAEEAEKRVQEAMKAAEEAKKRAEEAIKAAELARKRQEDCQVQPEPTPDPISISEESEEEDGCTEKELEDLIDTLIDSAVQPQAYTPGCGYPGCEQQQIIVIVEDDEEDPKPQEPQEDPVPDNEKITSGEEETIEEEIIEEEEVIEEEEEEETTEEETTEEEGDDDWAQTGYPGVPVEETQYLIYTTEEIFDHGVDEVTSSWDVDVEHTDNTKIKGSNEYSYGLWTYFRFNGKNKVLKKDQTMGVALLQGDDQDRLVTLIGTGHYKFRVYESENEQDEIVDYGKYLDGEWVYIYFGYKHGVAHGYSYWSRDSSIKSIKHTVMYQRITKSFKFISGTAGSKYSNFNGKVAHMRVILNKQALIEDEGVLVAAIKEQYPAPVVEELEYTEESFNDKTESDQFTETNKQHWDYDGYREYSVSTWFRYLRTQKKFMVIWRLTSNEDEYLNDKDNHGDRGLSLFQDEDNKYIFSTYFVQEQDVIEQKDETIEIQEISQQLWTFAYFGYKNDDFEYSIQYPDSFSEGSFQGHHYLAKYWALYLGRGKYYHFHGKTSHTTVRFGKGAYGSHKSFSNYKTGFEIFWPALKERKHDAKLISHSDEQSGYDTQLHSTTEDFMIDGAYEYGFGMWTKFFITNPTRIYEKPDQILVAQLGFMETSEQPDLAVYIGKGNYEFWIGTVRPVQYGKNLDGYWNYIYFSYSKLKQTAVGWINFHSKVTVERQEYDPFDFNPMNNYCRFFVGKTNIIGFNGKMAHAIIRVGPGAFIQDITQYEQYMTNYPAPVDAEGGFKEFEVTDENDVTTSEIDLFVYEEEATETLQYSVYGWFKYYGDLSNTDALTLIRMTNNEEDHLEVATIMGDRTLTAVQEGDDMILTTYDIGFIDTDFTVDRNTRVKLGEYRGIWMYIWLGYSRTVQSAGWFLGFPDISKGGVWKKTLHFSPKYLAIYFGKDGKNKDFDGKSRHLHACYGNTECFFNVDKAETEELLPAWIPYKLNNQFEFFIESDEEALILPTETSDSYIDLQVNQEQFPGADIEAISEYSVGVWTRWLMNYPHVLLQKAPFTGLLRMTTNKEHGDIENFGDRTLAAFVGEGSYSFSTYDIETDKKNVYSNLNYDFELEGYWNFIFMTYKRTATNSRAIGYVYFSNLNTVKRVEIQSAKNFLLRDYLRVVLGKKEFNFAKFQGKLFDLRVFCGSDTFVEQSEELTSKWLDKFRPQPPYKKKQENEPVQVEKAQVNEMIFKEYEEKYSGVFEYSVYGFAKGIKGKNITETTTLVRVTQNTPDIQGDTDYAGDRTLSIFIDKMNYIYSTYDYGDLETEEDDQGDISTQFEYGKHMGTWTYFYFGYSFKLKQAYAYIRYFDQTENSFLFEDCHHFVPHYLAVFFVDDNYYGKFNGEAFDWYLGVGDGAFTTNPEPGEWPVDPVPPPDKVLSALLANQGVNSGRLLRGG